MGDLDMIHEWQICNLAGISDHTIFADNNSFANSRSAADLGIIADIRVILDRTREG
jgi:hypothetical protein